MTEDSYIWVALVSAGVIIMLVVIPTLWTGAPPTPSGRLVRACVADALAAQDLSEGPIYDLGSGWGGMARVLAKRFPDRPVIGIESSYLPWLISALAQRLFGPGNLHVKRGDFRTMRLEGPAALVCYLGPDLSQDVVSVVTSAGMSTGSSPLIVVSCFFALPGLPPVDQRTARDLYRTPVYTYQV